MTMEIRNEDIKEVVIEIPEGHKHVRTRMALRSGETLIFQEATIANILRGFTTVKTHPTRRRVRLVGRWIASNEKKEGYAEWQLVEVDG